MTIGSVLLKLVARPVWTAAPAPKREEWRCPAPSCGRTVWRDNPALKGIWFVPADLELIARCARQHGAHDRHGGPLPVDDDPWLPTAEALDASAVPVQRRPDGSFVALQWPTALLYVPDDDGRAYEVRALDDLLPSDLVGTAPRRGRVVGHVTADEVAFDADDRLVVAGRGSRSLRR